MSIDPQTEGTEDALEAHADDGEFEAELGDGSKAELSTAWNWRDMSE